jgi:hypothetical protein
MPNSKYPQQLDTSVEIPPVRDNITEIGSDVINSLRAAIFNIEKTLGINPHGTTGNTVASRISKSLDENGNILKAALDRSNVLSGPIIDADVSKVAGIQEDKLKLDFPTRLLQSEISSLNSQIDQISSTIEQLSINLAVHLSPYAINVHKAKAIGVDAATVIAEDVASMALESQNLQAAFERIYNAHINYTGTNISSLNNSHLANQIFYDNSTYNDIISSSDVQGALDDLANEKQLFIKNVMLNTTSNGRIRKGRVVDGYESQDFNTLLLERSLANYTNTTGLSYVTFTLPTPTQPIEEIKEFDIVTIFGSINEEDNKDYQVKSVTLDGFGNVQNISVYGGPTGVSNSGVYIEVTKNQYAHYNLAGFSSTVRPRSQKTNTPDVQVLNPDSATIISNQILPSSITATNNAFNISIDGGLEITIETYDASYTEQSLDTIVQKINDQAIDQHLNFTAYKVKVKNCYELALAHNLPNFNGDIRARTLKVKFGAINDGSSELGFGYIIDQEVKGNTKNSLLVNGLVLSSFGSILSFSSSTIEILTGSLGLNLYTGTFASLGVRVGDLVVIDGSTDPADDGTYRVKNINDNTLNLDLTGALFSGDLSSTGRIYIVRATAPVGEFTFEEIVGTNGTILFDVFMDEEKNIFHKKRLEVQGSIQSGGFSAVVADVSKNFIVDGETAIVNVTTAGYATLTDPSGSNGESVFIGKSGLYKLFASDRLAYITLRVDYNSNPSSVIYNTIYGFKEIGLNNYHICRGSFATALGRILGTSTDPGVPSLVDKRVSGTVDSNIVADTFVEKYIEGPRAELRSSGVVRGCEVFDTSYVDGAEDYQTFSVSAGVLFVNGIRFEFPGVVDFRINTLDPYVVAIDASGCILASPYIPNPDDPSLQMSPYVSNNVAYLAEVSNDGTNTFITDLRLFVDNLDLKVLGDIKVSNNSKNGHFTSIKKAVAYAKRYKKIFPDLNPPAIFIEGGEYIIDETITIDFDLSISGCGPTTVIKRDPDFVASGTYSSPNVNMGSAIFLIGKSQNDESDDIVYGVTLKNFTFVSPLIKKVTCTIALTQPIIKSSVEVSPDAVYRFEGITFIGPELIDGASGDSDKIGEYVIFAGQQNPTTLSPVGFMAVGNIIVTNCKVMRMGLEYGGIKFVEAVGATFKNIIISNNIMKDMSPNVGDTGFILVEYPTVSNTQNIVEVGNVND